jgi:hypothetical protein
VRKAFQTALIVAVLLYDWIGLLTLQSGVYIQGKNLSVK